MFLCFLSTRTKRPSLSYRKFFNNISEFKARVIFIEKKRVFGTIFAYILYKGDKQANASCFIFTC